jgi:hypothetical protein
MKNYLAVFQEITQPTLSEDKTSSGPRVQRKGIVLYL